MQQQPDSKGKDTWLALALGLWALLLRRVWIPRC